VGHLTEDCHKDPNFKTKEKIDDDISRINAIKDDKKVFADSIVLTTALLKNCVKVQRPPYDHELEQKPKMQQEFIDGAAEKLNKNQFKRGAMMFDDYNYSQYNKFVLNMDPKSLDYEEDDKTEADNQDMIDGAT